MKISWGKGILFAIIFFMLATVFMVYISMETKFDLVTDNYYEKELKYQQVIDKVERTNMLDKKIKIASDQENVIINFPDQNVKGEVQFYRPSDSSKDFFVEIIPDEKGEQTIPVNNLQKGMWKVKIEWEMNNQNYFNEKVLML